jgi:hypothetical protein
MPEKAIKTRGSRKGQLYDSARFKACKGNHLTLHVVSLCHTKKSAAVAALRKEPQRSDTPLLPLFGKSLWYGVGRAAEIVDVHLAVSVQVVLEPRLGVCGFGPCRS